MPFEDNNHLMGNITAQFETRTAAGASNLAAQMQAAPKKQGKEKKPDRNLVSRAFPEQ